MADLQLCRMRWDDLSVLLEVSRARTMTEAAKRLGVDQTTISRRLQALEEQLGVQLVNRRRDGVQLTEAGSLAARSAEVMETVRLDLERTLVGTDTKLAGRLRVTTVEVMAHQHPDLFTSFGERYPAVELELETNISRRSLSRREADVAIRWSTRPDDGLIAHRLAHAHFAPYVTTSLRRSVGARAKLSKYPWLAFSSGSAPLVERFMREHVPDARIVCRYEDLLSMLSALRAGAGVGFIPCAFGDEDPSLTRVGPIHPELGYDIWCLTHPDLGATARVRSFIEHTRGYFESRADLYAGKKRRTRRA